jgi:galactan 5-O-arabinofuranosyltransferase
MAFAARYIDVDPLARAGQVSALAALQLRFAVLGLVLVAVLVVFHGRRRGYDTAKRVVCAAVAGLASGFLAGGVVVALRGTPWPLFGLSGDTGRLVQWSASIVRGHGNPNPTYPPLTLHALAWWAQLVHHGDTASAFRDVEIGGAAVTGPAAYLAWRLVLSPLWALVVGVVPAYAIIDPYKPYGAIVMIVLLPVFVVSVRHAVRVGDLSWVRVLVSAVLFGLLYSLLFLTYPGSSLWSAPGLIAAALLLFPWARDRVGKFVVFVGATVAVFAILCGWYVNDLAGPGTVDRAYGFDAYTDPAFFSMWRTDMPGDVGQWPPPGELAGVGLFSVLTFAGVGVALWLGWRRPLAVTVACVFAGTWLWRMEVASRMWATGSVQLWPRTGNQLLYCVLVLSAAGACFAASQLGARAVYPAAPEPAAPAPPFRLGAHVGALTAVLLVLGTAASSVSDYWMPAKTNSYKILAYVAQTMRKPDGTCPKYAPNHECSHTGDQSWLNNFAPPRNH